ncbi:MAG: class I SAM-dependent methyltransferase, partial [Micromonosporaceae bacterium]
APGGALLVIAAVRDAGGLVHGPPWPLTRAEVEAFAFGGLDTVGVEQLADPGREAPHRWRAEFRRSSR